MSDLNESSEKLLTALNDLRARSARTVQAIRAAVEVLQQAKLESMVLELMISDLAEEFEPGVTPRLGTEGVPTPKRPANIRNLLGTFMGPPSLDATGSILRFQSLSEEDSHEPPPAA